MTAAILDTCTGYQISGGTQCTACILCLWTSVIIALPLNAQSALYVSLGFAAFINFAGSLHFYNADATCDTSERHEKQANGAESSS